MGADDKKEASDPKPVPGSAEGKPTSTSAEDNKPSVSTPVVRDMDEDIPHPMFELYRHTILRGANLGSVVTLILGPPYLLYKRVWGMEFLRRMGSICAKGTAVGIAFGIVSTYLRIRDNADEQIYDRCYRLRYNVGQVRLDRFTYGGILIGGAAGMAARLSPSGLFMSGLQGASLGIGIAVFDHVATKPFMKK